MALGNWLGMGLNALGGLLGGGGSAIQGTIQQPAIGTQDMQEINALQTLQTQGPDSFDFGNDVMAPTGMVAPDFSSQIQTNGSVDGNGNNSSGGLGNIFGNDGMWKALQMGLAYKNDSENRKIKKKQINHNIKKDQNARERTKSVKASLGAGNTLSGSDFDYV